MQFYQHHIGDFKKDTSFLDHKARSQYLELMWLYYDQEQPLPDNVPLLAMKVQATEKEISLLLTLFFTKVEDKWHHTRIDEELESVYRKSESARKSAEARWNKGSMRTQSERNANGMLPITHNPLPNTHNNILVEEYSKEFESLWKAYPNKVKKDYCWKIWKKQQLDNKTDVVMKHLNVYKNCKKWKDGYVEHPSTYLNQKVYLDPVEEPRERKVI